MSYIKCLMLNMVKSYSFTISLTLEGEATSGPTIRLEFRQSNDRINLTNETKFSAISCALYFAGSLNNSGSTIYTLCILYDHGNISSNMLATNTIDYNALSCIVCLTTVRCIGLSLNVIVLRYIEWIVPKKMCFSLWYFQNLCFSYYVNFDDHWWCKTCT